MITNEIRIINYDEERIVQNIKRHRSAVVIAFVCSFIICIGCIHIIKLAITERSIVMAIVGLSSAALSVLMLKIEYSSFRKNLHRFETVYFICCIRNELMGFEIDFENRKLILYWDQMGNVAKYSFDYQYEKDESINWYEFDAKNLILRYSDTLMHNEGDDNK